MKPWPMSARRAAAWFPPFAGANLGNITWQMMPFPTRTQEMIWGHRGEENWGPFSNKYNIPTIWPPVDERRPRIDARSLTVDQFLRFFKTPIQNASA